MVSNPTGLKLWPVLLQGAFPEGLAFEVNEIIEKKALVAHGCNGLNDEGVPAALVQAPRATVRKAVRFSTLLDHGFSGWQISVSDKLYPNRSAGHNAWERSHAFRKAVGSAPTST